MHAEPVIMVVCPRTRTSSRLCGGCGWPSAPIEVVDVISHDPIAAPDESVQGARMADPGADDPEERNQAHALLTRALTDPNWRTASQALEDLMRKLLVVQRLLEAVP